VEEPRPIRIETRREWGGKTRRYYVFNCKACSKEIFIQKNRLKSSTFLCMICNNRSIRQKRPYEWLFNRVISSDIRAGRKTLLTYEQFLDFTKTDACYYCNNKIIWLAYSVHNRRHSISYNLDRLDSSLGYSKDNCVVCCIICNIMKNDQPFDRFIDQIKQIFFHLLKIGAV